MNQIRTYMAFSEPVDPAHLVVLPDMDLSFALASTLVTWDEHKQIKAGLAEKWDGSQGVLRLFVSERARWSDGSAISCEEVKRSLERGLKVHAQEHRSLKNLLEKIICSKENTIDFHLSRDAKAMDLLKKLTEPNFGIVSTHADGGLNLKRSSGAFYLDRQSSKELILKRNIHTLVARQEMADEIIIRKPPVDYDPTSILLKDPWPNLTDSTSLMPSAVFDEYKTPNFSLWRRPLDRIFLAELSPVNASSDGAALLRFINEKVNRDILLQGLSGHQKTFQLIPPGYSLHDKDFECEKELTQLPELFKSRPLRISYFSGRVSPVLVDNIKKEIKRITNHEPKLIPVLLSDFEEHHRQSKYDIHLGPAGIADPDPEGLLSYYIEGETAVIAPKPIRFAPRLDEARKETDAGKRLQAMRKILTDAVCKGQVLPLFHHSTIAIGRDGVDLSSVPTSDESATLSKIRFRKKENI